MSRGHPELRAVADHLDLPQPVRARVILELAADLAGLEAELVASGVPREEARARAVRTLVPSPEALRELREVHRSLYARLLDRFSDPVRHRLERAVLAIASVTLFGLALARLLGSDLLDVRAPLMLPVLATALVVISVSVWELFALHVKKDHDLDRLERGLRLLPFAATAAVALAGAGFTLDLYGVAGGLEADLAGQAIVLLRWLRRDMGLLSVGLMTALAALGMWLLLATGVARVRQAEAAILAGLDLDGYAQDERIGKESERS